MTTLTVTARGQVKFKKDVLQHLGIKPGDKIELDLLPDGRGVIKAARQRESMAGFVGLLSNQTDRAVWLYVPAGTDDRSGIDQGIGRHRAQLSVGRIGECKFRSDDARPLSPCRQNRPAIFPHMGTSKNHPLMLRQAQGALSKRSFSRLPLRCSVQVE